MLRPRLLALVFACITLVGASLPGSAQTPSASSIPPIDEMEGIQSGISRTFVQDVESLLAATPDLDLEDVFKGLLSTTVTVLEFDNAGNAATAYDVFSKGVAADLPAMAQGGTPEVSTGDLADIGSQASYASLHSATSDEFEAWLEYVTVQRDNYVFIVWSLTSVEADTGLATSVAAWVAQNGQADGEEAIFAADGGSSGGLWGFMPPTGDAVLKGLIPVTDEVIYPTPGS